ncbi:DUF397 domain-containing protein [Streptomyces soliscabiei]|uniref:DUF397 domain-containing protein n=1 Tax=Streptomyces soliscabiei TaxID=588897 RepID=UPI0029B2E111|nr:DUF397 domain-containing protein [Streptomyces sp. NY05-11A]MDX2679112.1 DUF397 domain-containing protein [Streptomyces sp. NY05-11A]
MSTALEWFKSSYSSNEGGNCVEVASHASAVHVRDSKTPDGPILTLAPGVWSDFLIQLGSVA